MSRFVNFVDNFDNFASSYATTNLNSFFYDVILSWCFIAFMFLGAALTLLSRIEWPSSFGLSVGLSGLESSKISSVHSTHLCLTSSFLNMILPDLSLIGLLAALVFLLCIVLSSLSISEMFLFVGFQVSHIDCSCFFYFCFFAFHSYFLICFCILATVYLVLVPLFQQFNYFICHALLLSH